MATRRSTVVGGAALIWSCAGLAVAAAVGAMVSLVDTRWVAILLIAIPIGIAGFMFYRRYTHQELPLAATFGSGLVALASVTATFNGIRPFRNATVADLLLVAGAVLLIVAFISERYTWPTYPLAGSIGAILLGISVAASTAASRTLDQDLQSGLFFLIGAVLTPLVVAAAGRSPVSLKVITFLWVTSGAVNGAASALDNVGITTLGPTLTGLSYFGRQAGLTIHPNHLGLACAMVLPVGFVQLLVERRLPSRMVWAVLTALAVVGVLISGSRGATVGIVIGPAVSAVLVSKRRLRTLAIAAVLVASTASIAAFAPPDLISVARLTGQASTQGSNADRLQLLSQSLTDIFASPIIGNGYSYSRDAHNIFLQVAAAGGVLGLVGFLLLVGAIVHSGVRSSLRTDVPFRLQILAAGLVGSLVTWLAVGIVENPVYDRYLYWPAGLVLAVQFLLARRVGLTERATSPSSGPRGTAPTIRVASQGTTHSLGKTS